MEALQFRIDTFSKAKRVKNPAKSSSSVQVKWPHPPSFTATPESLAEAGFYFNPSYDDRDNVTCYVCGKHIGDWESEDDPFDIHWAKCAATCCWASVRCGLRDDMDQHGRYVFTDKTRVPSSKAMEKARLDTFTTGDGWMHDQTRNHGASSTKMARAGFVYTPQEPGDDLASCFYCNISLSGWDAGDDPMEEHRKREKKSGRTCAFLAHTDKPPSKAQSTSTKPPSRQSTKPHSRTASKSKHQDIMMPTKTHDGDPDADVQSDSPPASTAPAKTAKTPRKARSTSTAKTPRGQTRSSSRTGAKQHATEDEEEVEAEEEEAPKRKGRSRSKSVARSVPPSEDEALVEPPTAKKRAPARARSKSVARSRSVAPEKTEAEEEGELRKPSTSRSRSKPPKSAPESEVEADEEPTRKPSRSRSKSKPPPPIASESEVDDAPVHVPRKSSRTTKPRPTVVMEEEHEPEEEEEVKPKKLARTRSKAKIVPEPEPEEEVEEEARERDPRAPAPAPATKTQPPSRASSRTKTKPPRAASPSVEDEMQRYTDPGPNEPEPKPVPIPVLVPVQKKPTTTTTKRTASSSKPAPVVQDELDVEDASPPAQTEMPPLFVPKRNGAGKGKEKGKEKEKAREPVLERSPFVVQEEEPKKAGKTKPGVISAKAVEEQTEMEKKMVGILTDDEEEEEVKLKEEVVPTKAKAKKLTSKQQLSHPQEPEAKSAITIFGKKPSSKKHPVVEAVASAPASPRHDTDVEMALVEDSLLHSEDVHMDMDDNTTNTSSYSAVPPPPTTPPRAVPPSLPASAPLDSLPAPPSATTTIAPTTLVLPALSKLPFTPLAALSDLELDMTVEDWIRYQMEAEYDKFRRDGERELLRFRKRAEEARKVIDGL